MQQPGTASSCCHPAQPRSSTSGRVKTCPSATASCTCTWRLTRQGCRTTFNCTTSSSTAGEVVCVGISRRQKQGILRRREKGNRNAPEGAELWGGGKRGI
eukprot:227882-Chlamydomonas_euryale.AAC.1